MRTHEFNKLCGHTIRQSQTRSHPRSTHARNKGPGIGPARPVPASLRLSLPFDDLVVMARVPHPIHPELGRESPQRRWYCVLRRGRVGRRQVFQGKTPSQNQNPFTTSRQNPLHASDRRGPPTARSANHIEEAIRLPQRGARIEENAEREPKKARSGRTTQKSSRGGAAR